LSAMAEGEEKKTESWCFPMQPFAICGGLCFCLPATWKKIQDSTHLILVFGVMSCIAIILKSILVLMSPTECFYQDELFCGREISSVIFGMLLATYVSGIISQWDEQLMAKEQMCKEQKQKLLNSYNELLGDMDGLLTNATESASGLAERSFESKRRDFQRFLERAKSRFTVYQGDLDMLNQFRRFCVNWLNVFQECSIDPLGNPTLVVTDEELQRQSTIVEVADLCLERLRVTEVRFISSQRDKDKNIIDQRTKDYKRHTIKQGPRMLAITADGNTPPAANNNNAGGSNRSLEELSRPKGQSRWLKCCGGGCRWQVAEPYGTKALGCGCIDVTFLSKQHSMLLFVFFLGVLLFALDLYEVIGKNATGEDLGPEAVSAFFLIIAQLCVTVVLMNFEDIDTVQKLEREVQELKEQNEVVGKQRENMKEFWSNAQNLTELWLYRTVPRLDLYKELHSQLEDENEEDLLTHISGANDALEDLEKRLGALEAWRNDGDLKTEDKKLFGKTVNELCQIGQFGDMLTHLQDDIINGPVMAKLKDLPQSAPH